MKYYMGDLICDVSTFCVRSCDMDKITVCDEIIIENHKEKIWKEKKF